MKLTSFSELRPIRDALVVERDHRVGFKKNIASTPQNSE